MAEMNASHKRRKLVIIGNAKSNITTLQPLLLDLASSAVVF